MAEYIDRALVLHEVERYKKGITVNIKAELKALPIEDVIERSKIDKAIEELRKEIEENHLSVIDYADGEWIVKDFVYGAIERLKDKLRE